MPLIWTEYNAAYDNETAVTDSAYMGPFLANTIRECDGLTEMMSYWTFSDVFEEQGVVKTPFYGGFGLLAERSIPKAGVQRLRAAASSRRHAPRRRARIPRWSPPQRRHAGNRRLEFILAGRSGLAKDHHAAFQRRAQADIGPSHHRRQGSRLSAPGLGENGQASLADGRRKSTQLRKAAALPASKPCRSRMARSR